MEIAFCKLDHGSMPCLLPPCQRYCGRGWRCGETEKTGIGASVSSPARPSHLCASVGLDASGRWSSLASKSRSHKSLEEKCETLGMSIDSWFLERIESANEETVSDLLNSLPRMALFHAMCAKWIDTAFRSRSVPLEKLAAFVGPNPKWTGDHLKCPDDASIQERQKHWWRHFEPVYPASRLDDPLWMDNLMKEVRRAIAWDKDGDNETDEIIPSQSVSAAADFFMEEGRLAQFYLGSYVGSLAMVPAPLVAPASSGDIGPEEPTVPKAGLGLHNPISVPE
ncbi:hypothetical protein DFJ73DRAFT_855477 [Zopfochytrium polystomum]|nr:hypothetical protein DFJ73DRAFT_855477 [Zopfochytrium polystomum]